MSANEKMTRRSVLQAAAALTPVAIAGCAEAPPVDDPEPMGDMEAMGDMEPMVSADDPVARAVLYFPDSRDVPADHPLAVTHQPEQTCAKCVHVRGEAGAGARECPVFPGRRVSEAGWCSVWAKA